jgi:stage II sporulation protein M
VPLLLLIVIAAVESWLSYRWATVNIPRMLSEATPKDMTDLVNDARQSIGLAQAHQHLSALFIFANNVRATFLIFLGGTVSFSVLGMMAYLVNVGLIGAVLGVFKLIGFSPWALFAAGLLPHGIFEIPALLVATALMLRFGAVLVTPQIGKSMGQVVIELVADWAKVFVGVVIPLLAVAAVVEAYITPVILQALLR